MPKRFPVEVCGRFVGLMRAGATVRAATEAVGVSHGTGVAWWAEARGMNAEYEIEALTARHPVLSVTRFSAAEPGRRRPLSVVDRAVIGVGLRARWSLAAIGRYLCRQTSVISREVGRNSVDGVYDPVAADRSAAGRRTRPKSFRLIENPGLCRRIEEWMDQGWSPGLVAAMLKREHPDNIMERVSHETIYQALYVQTRGQLRADLHRQLSLKRKRRKAQGTSRKGSARYAAAFKISDRPAEADDRAVPGHWEGDLIMGAGNGSAVGTLVERSTRFTILLHLPGRHDANTVAEAMIKEMNRLPEHLRRSITWDRGSELAEYERIQLELGTQVFFCDPHAPWQRGSNENTNRLLRFWLAKGTDLSVHTATDLRRIADTLNRRPRPTLDLQTPADRLAQLLTNPAAA
jgi:IS30 family transposase